MAVRAKRTTAAEVIGSTFGSDVSEIRDCVYQPTRYSRPSVFTVGDDYFAVSPHKPKHDVGGAWEPWSDQFFAAKANTILWVSKAGAE